MTNQAHRRDRLGASFHEVSLLCQAFENFLVLILAFSPFLSWTTAVIEHDRANELPLWRKPAAAEA